MAKQNTEVVTQTAAEIATQNASEQSLATVSVPEDLLRDAGRGLEEVGPDDVKPPRILLCQSGTPQRKEGNAKFIPGLNELDIFNDLSEENYKRGPLKFCVIKVLKPRYIEFEPMETGGGIRDFDVPHGDPRTRFTVVDGKRIKPAATMFREFLVWLPDQQEVAVLSMKGDNLKVGVQLNGKNGMPLKGEVIDPSLKGKTIFDPPAWARTFSVTTTMKNENNYAWGVYNLKFEGLTPTETRQTCSELATIYANKRIVVDVEDDTSFDTAAMDGEVGDAKDM